MPDVGIIDTTLRDGQQSIWAGRLSTAMMLAVIDDIDAAGYESVEFARLEGSMRCFTEFGEDPSSWLRLGPRRVRNTELRWHGPLGWGEAGLIGMFSRTAAETLDETRTRMVLAQGITLTRTSNAWNNMDALARNVQFGETLGVRNVINLIYSISPRHTDDYYVQKATEAAAIKPFRICFKDVGGILTPERAKTLLPRLVAVTGDVEWEFHAHCCTALASACMIIAVESGMTHLHTGIPPLADGDAQPSVFTTVRNLHALGYDTGIDLAPLERASSTLYRIARQEGFPVGAPVDLDYRHYQHQIPGGMISHLVYQLEQVGQLDRLPEVLGETARVRAEFGYPIMVTPLSQFVGSQAAINVITGARYESVTDEAIRYALGHYGDEAPALMDPDVRATILDRSRTAELVEAMQQPPQSLADLRAVYGDVTDEELVHLTQCGPDALAVLRAQPDIGPYRFLSPEADWLRRLPTPRGGAQQVELQAAGLTLRVGLRELTRG